MPPEMKITTVRPEFARQAALDRITELREARRKDGTRLQSMRTGDGPARIPPAGTAPPKALQQPDVLLPALKRAGEATAAQGEAVRRAEEAFRAALRDQSHPAAALISFQAARAEILSAFLVGFIVDSNAGQVVVGPLDGAVRRAEDAFRATQREQGYPSEALRALLSAWSAFLTAFRIAAVQNLTPTSEKV